MNQKKDRNLPKGVYKTKDKYYVQYKRKHIGTFNTLDEAINAYNKKSEIQTETQTQTQTETQTENKKDQTIVRNNEGIAIIVTSKKEEILVDDDKLLI